MASANTKVAMLSTNIAAAPAIEPAISLAATPNINKEAPRATTERRIESQLIPPSLAIASAISNTAPAATAIVAAPNKPLLINLTAPAKIRRAPAIPTKPRSSSSQDIAPILETARAVTNNAADIAATPTAANISFSPLTILENIAKPAKAAPAANSPCSKVS